MAKPEGYFAEMGEGECRELLATQVVGRVAWISPTGPMVLPVTFTLDEERILFRTSPDSVLSNLAIEHRVAFEVDSFDVTELSGWSVVVRGTTMSLGEERLNPLPKPWAPGPRNVLLAIKPYRITGRRVAAAIQEQ